MDFADYVPLALTLAERFNYDRRTLYYEVVPAHGRWIHVESLATAKRETRETLTAT